MLKTLKKLASLYAGLGTLYFIWAMTILQFRHCNPFGSGCDLPTRFMTIAVAAVRGMVWLPEMLIAIANSQFVDWLFLRSFYAPPVDEMVKIIFG